MPRQCSCGVQNDNDHFLICKKGGYVHIRHDALVQVEADIMKEARCMNVVRGGGGGKALTMTMTSWNLPHGQWSKKLTMTMTPSILPMVNGQIDQF